MQHRASAHTTELFFSVPTTSLEYFQLRSRFITGLDGHRRHLQLIRNRVLALLHHRGTGRDPEQHAQTHHHETGAPTKQRISPTSVGRKSPRGPYDRHLRPRRQGGENHQRGDRQHPPQGHRLHTLRVVRRGTARERHRRQFLKLHDQTVG